MIQSVHHVSEQRSTMCPVCTHHGGRVEELARAAGVGLHYLPSYSPDLNPIEHMFRKLKAYLRKAAAGPAPPSPGPSRRPWTP